MKKKTPEQVVPLEGTWIEIVITPSSSKAFNVVPLEGTWIEIEITKVDEVEAAPSYPLRVRGLKSL